MKSELKYEDIKSKLKRIFSNESETSNNKFQEINIKSEPTFYSQNEPQSDSENEYFENESNASFEESSKTHFIVYGL